MVDDPEVTEAEPKVAVTPAGAPETDSATACAVPDTVAVATLAEADPPAVTVAAVGETETEKSFAAGTSVTMAWAIWQPETSFDQFDCMAKDPVAKAMFWAPVVPPVPFHEHLSEFSMPVALSHQPPPGF